MNFTINLPSKDVLFGERVVVENIEDKNKNITYYIKFYCNTLEKNTSLFLFVNGRFRGLFQSCIYIRHSGQLLPPQSKPVSF